jgi:sortase A
MAEQNPNNPNDKHLASADPIRDLLNLDKAPESPASEEPATPEPLASSKPEPSLEKAELKVGQIPPDLPFLETLEEPPRNLTETLKPAPNEPQTTAGPIDQIIGPAKEKGHEAYAFVLWLLKTLAPYAVIFAIGLALYFFYFSDFSFTNFLRGNSITLEKITDNTNRDLEKLKEDQKDAYHQWMAQFFFAVNDESIISMDTDVSGNGLTNFEKYLLDLNPKVYSTRGLNKPDGQLVAEGINPWTGKPFTDKQKELVEKYINKELVSNRITAAALTRGVTKFAQYVNPGSPYYVEESVLREYNQQNPIITSPEVASNQSSYNAAQQANAVNVKAGSGIDVNIPGRLEIPANNISVPVIWTKDVKDFDADLKKGIVHYPGTAMPGQIGTSYISGHSSGYLWDKSPYKQIFATLGQVKDGTSFSITVTQTDGKVVKYHYVVSHRGEFDANDQAQFVNTAESIVALSTCWPVGTTARRLVLFGKLTQTEI